MGPALAAGQLGTDPHGEPGAVVFGRGRPQTVTELPLGRLRSTLEGLPDPARQKALAWLQGIEFPANDAASLRVDRSGGIYYADTELPTPPPADESAGAPATAGAAVPVSPFPASLTFHSRPGSDNVIFIDFDGHVVTGTAWNDDLGRDPITARVFSTDSDTSTYSDTEQAQIKRIWQRMAEDYAPFDVDVTTEEPAVIDRTVARVLITRNTDITGQPNPASGAGGVAYVNVFGLINFAYYSPAWVYHNNLSNVESYTAEAGTHEAGHNLGLSHDGRTDGTEYYGGHGSGDTSWGPIMGASYNRQVTQWSKGEYYLANNTQDDLAIIAGKVGYRADDHGDTSTASSFLQISNGTQIVSTDPESDPDNTEPANKGILERSTDIDVFSLTAGTGPLELTVAPWVGPAGTRGGNADVRAALYDETGSLVLQSDPTATTAATLAGTVTQGVYRLQVDAVGAGDPFSATPTGYTEYGSLGQFFVSGTVVDGSGIVIPPQAAVSPTNISDTGIGAYTFQVTYTDDAGVDISSLGGTDIRVTGPNSYDHLASFSGVDNPADGSPRVATYTVDPPGSTWVPADNGTYAILMASNEVFDVEGAAVAPGLLGTFTSQVPQVIYAARMDADPGWALDGDWAYGVPAGNQGDPPAGATGDSVIGYNLQGQYAKNLALVYATTTPVDCGAASAVTLRFKRWLGVVRNDDAVIDVSADGSTWHPVWSAGGDVADSAWTTVQYDLTPVAASQAAVQVRWGMGANQDGRLSFGWNLDDVELLGNGAGIDTEPPAATLNASDITQGGAPVHEFTVLYTDDVAIAVATLDGADISVTGPAAYSNLAALVGTDDPTDGSPRTATYRIDAPAGTWGPEDNGAYQVLLLDASVEDLAGNAVAETALGGFTVAVPTSNQAIVASPLNVSVPEGGTNQFQVSLAEQPAGAVTVTVTRISGDTDLSVAAGASRVFDALDWNTPQPITLAAAMDPDQVADSAVFRCAADGIPPTDVTATEQEALLYLLTVAVNNPAWGSAAPTGGLYQSGSEIEVTATASNYYHFATWAGDITSVDNPVAVTITSNTALLAVFDEIMTTSHPTPHWWLADNGFTGDFEQVVSSIGSNGFTVWESYIAGLDPNDPASIFYVSRIAVEAGDGETAVDWPTRSGRLYTVFWSTNVAGGFAPLPGGTDLPWTQTTYTDTVHGAEPAGHYRVDVRLAP